MQPCCPTSEIATLAPSSLARGKSLRVTYDSVVVFFFFLPLFLARGSSRIFRISSSVILLSVLNLVKSQTEGPPSLVMPFLVMAARLGQ